jgi:hypothetical protein
MKNVIIIKKHRLALVKINFLIDDIQRELINDVFDLYQNVTALIKFTRDVKRLYLHSLIYNICEFYSRNILEKYTKVLITDFTLKEMSLEIYKYIEPEIFYTDTCKLLYSKRKLLPLPILNAENHLQQNGKREETIQKILQTVEQFKITTPSLREIKKEAKREGLLFMEKYYTINKFISLWT